MLIFALVYYATAIGNHYFFRSFAYDYGLYNFAWYDYAHFHLSKCPVYYADNINFLQDHFSLTLVYFAPVYWLLNWLTGSYTLLLVQVSMLLVGGWATYKLVITKTSDEWLGIGALLYYFLLQGHFSAFVGDCNVIVLSAAFIPLFLYCFEIKRYALAAVVFVLAMLSKENMPLWFISILPIVMLWHRKDKKILWACTAYIVVSILYFIVLFKVIIPHFETADRKYNLFNYSALGTTPFEALKYIMHHPLHTLKMMFVNTSGDPQFDGVKKEFYLVYLISGGFVLFFRPQYFVWFILLLAQKMLNDEQGRWSIEWHYAIEVVTMLPIAVFIILSSLKNKRYRYIAASLVCLLTFSVTWYKMDASNHAMAGTPTIKENLLDSGYFKPRYNVKEVNRALSLIPADASVSASASILSHLAERKAIYTFPKLTDALYGDAQYIAAFSFYEYADANISDGQYNNAVYKALISPDWTILDYDSPFLLLKRQARAVPYKPIDSITCNNETISPDRKNLIDSKGQQVSGAANRDSAVTRHGKYSSKLTKESPFGMTLSDSTLAPGSIVIASIWRHSGDDQCAIVVSDGGQFYHASNDVVTKDANGWEQIMVYAQIPPGKHKIGFYAWNMGDKTVWVDDLKILIYPQIQLGIKN